MTALQDPRIERISSMNRFVAAIALSALTLSTAAFAADSTMPAPAQSAPGGTRRAVPGAPTAAPSATVVPRAGKTGGVLSTPPSTAKPDDHGTAADAKKTDKKASTTVHNEAGKTGTSAPAASDKPI